MKLASDESDIHSHSCFFANWVVMEKRVLSAFSQDLVFDREREKNSCDCHIVDTQQLAKGRYWWEVVSSFLAQFTHFLPLCGHWRNEIDSRLITVQKNEKWEWEETANSLSPVVWSGTNGFEIILCVHWQSNRIVNQSENSWFNQKWLNKSAGSQIRNEIIGDIELIGKESRAPYNSVPDLARNGTFNWIYSTKCEFLKKYVGFHFLNKPR